MALDLPGVRQHGDLKAIHRRTDVASPTLEEVLERAGDRNGGHVSLAVAAAALREDRDSR